MRDENLSMAPDVREALAQAFFSGIEMQLHFLFRQTFGEDLSGKGPLALEVSRGDNSREVGAFHLVLEHRDKRGVLHNSVTALLEQQVIKPELRKKGYTKVEINHLIAESSLPMEELTKEYFTVARPQIVFRMIETLKEHSFVEQYASKTVDMVPFLTEIAKDLVGQLPPGLQRLYFLDGIRLQIYKVANVFSFKSWIYVGWDREGDTPSSWEQLQAEGYPALGKLMRSWAEL